MINDNDISWNSLERWSPRLFFLGCAMELVFASLNGVAFLVDTFAFNRWFGHTILFGRLVVLLGIAGLSVGVVNRNPRLGRLSRIVVSVAIVFATGLLVLATLAGVGFTTPIIAVFGLGTVITSAITYSLFGAAIIRTGAYSSLIGGLLLAATVVLLAVFVGLMALPFSTRLIGAVGEGVLLVIFLSIWYLLRADGLPSDRKESVPDSTPW